MLKCRNRFVDETKLDVVGQINMDETMFITSKNGVSIYVEAYVNNMVIQAGAVVFDTLEDIIYEEE